MGLSSPRRYAKDLILWHHESALEPNSSLSHYRILSKLGAVEWVKCTLRRHVGIGPDSSTKDFTIKVASDKDRLQRFTQEARTVSNLNHPNILTVHEFGQTDSSSFMATEMCGMTLRQHLSNRRLKLVDFWIVRSISLFADAAHEAGVTHRDLKPENVMVRRDHIVKVLDFGLAKPSASPNKQIDSEAGTKVLVHTEPGVVMGTTSYMSPEQSAGKGVDQRTDIWSVGVVLYEMIAGRLPFEGKDVHRQIIAIQEAEPVPLSQQVEGLPERLEEIVGKCLAKEKDERYQTAKDLLIDLRNLRRKLDVDAEIDRTSCRSCGPLAAAHRGRAHCGRGRTLASRRRRFTQLRAPNICRRNQAVQMGDGPCGSGGHCGSYRPRPLSERGKNEVGIRSIAVMPFVNESGNADIEYLSDGMTETLITSLSHLPNLIVKARSSVFRYKGKETDSQRIGKE